MGKGNTIATASYSALGGLMYVINILCGMRQDVKVKSVLVEFKNCKELKIYKSLGFMLFNIVLRVKKSQAQVLVGEN